LYAGQFRILGSFASLANDRQESFSLVCLLGINCAVGALLIAAAANRFAYVSFSFEGQSVWLLQCAPIHPRSLVRAKFIGWLGALALTGSSILLYAAWRLDAPLSALLVTVIGIVAITYGIVGLAVGQGARYANYSWVSFAELAVSAGSFLFMLSSFLYLTICLPLLCLAFYFSVMTEDPILSAIGCSSALLLIGVITHLTTNHSLNLAEKSFADRDYL